MHPEIKTPGRWRQDCEFKVSLSPHGKSPSQQANAGWAPKPDDLTLSLSTPKMEERNQLMQTVLTVKDVTLSAIILR